MPTTRLEEPQKQEGKNMAMNTATAQAVYDRQRAYVESSQAVADLIDGRLFVESMRKLGYRDPARAADELVDNAIEAGAENVHVLFGYPNKTTTKPDAIAFADDGHGMIPEMVAAACKWGGTDRYDSRAMFGRFGFGLPSASVSQGRRFTVWSRNAPTDFYRVTIDVDDISDGKYSKDGRVIPPEAAPDGLPDWVAAELADKFPGGQDAVRTVVVWEKLDSGLWRTTSALERNLLQRFGVTYRGYLRTTTIAVNGKPAEPIDPLFTTPGARYYEAPPAGAEPQPGLRIPVSGDDGKPLGEIKIRYAYLPPTFMSRRAPVGSPHRARLSIRSENNGLIFTRRGRQVDVVARSEVFVFQNNARYSAVEIDFPPTMDDLFGVTTSKQSVDMSERLVQILRQNKVNLAIRHLQDRYETDAKAARSQDFEGEGGDLARTSEKIMEQSSDVLRKRPRNQEQEQEAQENLQREIDRTAKETGVQRKLIAAEKERETAERPFKIEFQPVIEGPFYRPELRGSQLVIILNTAHPFFTEIYSPLQGFEGKRVRAGLELLLFVLGQAETEAPRERRNWYRSERGDWSVKLSTVLGGLEDTVGDLAADLTDEDEGTGAGNDTN